MENLNIPEFVMSILCRLNEAGFRAYIVGGTVRDMLLGKAPHDWDITTSALPEEVQSLFERTVDTGLKHGTVTVMCGGGTAEVTTFRMEAGYSDCRHPDRVDFVSDLEEDLKRRDFTINAMAMEADGRIIDCFGGKNDLENGVIRCVGDPSDRFNEDALRMLRALRFSASLEFDIEPRTLTAIKECAHLAAHLSAERVRDEVLKTLLSGKPETLKGAIGFGLLNNYLKPAEVSLDGLKKLPAEENVRLCAFCFALKENGLIFSVNLFLTRLRFSNNTISLVTKAVSVLESALPRIVPAMKRLLRDFGRDAVFCAAGASGDEGFSSLLEKVVSSGECFSLRQLAVSGGDIEALGFYGIEVGKVLSALLEHVINNPKDNERSVLQSMAKTFYKA